jgi:hypothetical protein
MLKYNVLGVICTMDNIRYYVYVPLCCCVHCVVIRW